MLGINELGYDRNVSYKRYAELVEHIRELQPDAWIVLEANLHVTQAQSEKDNIFNNENINQVNENIRQLAQENGIECIDMFSITKAMYEDAYKADSTASGEVSNLASRLFAPGEKTHHSKLGGFAVACKLAEQIKGSSLGLASGVVAPSKVTAADDKGYTEFMVMSNGTFTGYDKNPAGVYDESYVDTYWTDFVNNSIASAISFASSSGCK